MKAAIWTAYGSPDVITVGERPMPSPKPQQILVKVHNSTVTSGDAKMRRFDVPTGLWLPTRLAFGVFKPRQHIPGMDFAGEVIEVGSGVNDYSVGDRVFGTTDMALGAHAEYLCIDARKTVAKLPDDVPYADAAALIFGGITALHFLDERVEAGHKVLINGATGGVGSMAAQLAKLHGAEITAICSAANHALAATLGAVTTVDYRQTDLPLGTTQYDLILDCVGNLSLAEHKTLLAPNGKLIAINTGLLTMLRSLTTPQLVCGVAMGGKQSLHRLVELYQTGDLRPVIQDTCPLEDIAEAHRCVDSGHKCGSVLISLNVGSN
ncbi:MAG: NAD(P)-dependent alcohol dehydrogenase [Gammaproteobacteria bacterium]|nr:NAD(P)-dependent alcohol dehydrogenase [Gammaproteobacteria bacterium]